MYQIQVTLLHFVDVSKWVSSRLFILRTAISIITDNSSWFSLESHCCAIQSQIQGKCAWKLPPSCGYTQENASICSNSRGSAFHTISRVTPLSPLNVNNRLEVTNAFSLHNLRAPYYEMIESEFEPHYYNTGGWIQKQVRSNFLNNLRMNISIQKF